MTDWELGDDRPGPCGVAQQQQAGDLRRPLLGQSGSLGSEPTNLLLQPTEDPDLQGRLPARVNGTEERIDYRGLAVIAHR